MISSYTYNIISVDPQSKCMEVIYAADGFTPMHIGVRLPFEGESLDAVIAAFAPVRLWEESVMEVVIPAVGTTGIHSVTDPIGTAPAGGEHTLSALGEVNSYTRPGPTSPSGEIPSTEF
jgi:hypothetical protein